MARPFSSSLGAMALGLVALSPPAEASPLPPAPSRTFQLTAPQLFALAEEMIRQGDETQAAILLDALARDPDPNFRNEARFRQAALFEKKGEDRAAAVMLRRILDERPDASPVRLKLASLFQKMGDEQSALRQLRAVQSSKLPIEVARMVDRYSLALRARQPVGASIEIAVAPDSNINRATRSDTVGTVFGPFDIDRDGKAKSGTGLSLRGQAFRRIPIGRSANLIARLSTSADLYSKSDFNDVAADLTVGPELILGRNRLRIDIGAARRWAGQKPFQDHARLALSGSRPLGARAQVSADISAALIDNHFNDLQDGRSVNGRIGVERALTPTTGIAFSLAADRQSLKDSAYSTTGWRAGLLGWREVGRTTLTATAEYGRLAADDRLVLLPEKRSERSLRLGLGATLRQFTFGGFAPVARLNYERNRSTVEFYDYRRLRAEWGVSRAF